MATKVIDADKESEYGYVYGVSGPGDELVVQLNRLRIKLTRPVEIAIALLSPSLSLLICLAF